METKKDKIKNVFREGAISSVFVGEAIAKHQHKTEIGAHQIFLGQVRNDMIDGKEVVAIEYSAYEEMANKVFHEIKEEAFTKFQMTCMHIYHSKGRVNKGEICLFVFTSSPHRRTAIESCEWVVERIKEKAPVFGKEVFEDESFVWKENN